MISRRVFLQTVIGLGLSNSLCANDFKDLSPKNSFVISINGELDDDLIILNSTQEHTHIQELFQMHNHKGFLKYQGEIYKSNHIPGYIDFNKEIDIEDDEVITVILANEREEANLKERTRTHYKNEKLFFNNQVFLPALMPEYDSIPHYPLWFSQGENPMVPKDGNNKDHNYYNLFENTSVQIGIIVPFSGEANVFMFDQKNKLRFTYVHNFTSECQPLVSNELKNKEIQEHPFVEINNILLSNINDQISNEDFIEKIVIKYNEKMYSIVLPYPAMYPNLIYGVSVKNKKEEIN